MLKMLEENETHEDDQEKAKTEENDETKEVESESLHLVLEPETEELLNESQNVQEEEAAKETVIESKAEMKAKKLAALCNLDASSLLQAKPKLGRGKGSDGDDLILVGGEVDDFKKRFMRHVRATPGGGGAGEKRDVSLTIVTKDCDGENGAFRVDKISYRSSGEGVRKDKESFTYDIHRRGRGVGRIPPSRHS